MRCILRPRWPRGYRCSRQTRSWLRLPNVMKARSFLFMVRKPRDEQGMSSKVYPDAASALRGIVKEGMTLMCGGFGACGIPENLIDALHASRIGNLTVVSNNAGLDGVGLGLLLQTHQIRKM